MSSQVIIHYIFLNKMLFNIKRETTVIKLISLSFSNIYIYLGGPFLWIIFCIYFHFSLENVSWAFTKWNFNIFDSTQAYTKLWEIFANDWAKNYSEYFFSMSPKTFRTMNGISLATLFRIFLQNLHMPQSIFLTESQVMFVEKFGHVVATLHAEMLGYLELYCWQFYTISY